MKVAYHFDSQAEGLPSWYRPTIETLFFNAIRAPKRLPINTKILMGDLLMGSLIDSVRRQHRTAERITLIQAWVSGEMPIWSTLRPQAREQAFGNTIFVLGLEAIDDASAHELDRRLSPSELYLGALEVDDVSPLHWELYSNMIGPAYRLTERGVSVFWDGVSDDSKDSAPFAWLKRVGVGEVKFEPLNARYTIFDVKHTFEDARRAALWKRRASGLLGFIAEDVITKLSDPAPELGDRLYSAMKALDTAETEEDYAHVMLTCRRLFEYVTDCILPPEPTVSGERKLGPANYKNRLLAFADRQRASDTSIELVTASVMVWAAQVDALSSLSNKGVHGAVHASEVRRCLVRTILLLDDIAALKGGEFTITAKPDMDLVRRISRAGEGDDSE
jgi:hypothetical protein